MNSVYKLLIVYCLDLCDIDNLPNGIVLTLGQGDMGQLGLGDEILSRKKPAIVKELINIRMKKIAAGALHTLCITDDNKVCIYSILKFYKLVDDKM